MRRGGVVSTQALQRAAPSPAALRPRPLRVAHFTNALQRGGAEQHILGLLRHLDPSRFQQWLVCPPELAAQLAPDLPATAGVWRCLLRRPRHVKAAIQFSQWLRRQRVDVVHSHLFYSSLFATPVARWVHVPVVVETPHLREHWRQGWKAHYFVDRCLSRWVSGYIAVSNANAQYLRQTKGIAPGKIRVICNGVHLSELTPSDSGAAAVARRARLGLDESNPLLLVPGRLETQKGHAVLLRALTRIREAFPLTHAAFAGEGSLRAELTNQAAALGLGRAVHFLGRQSDIAAWLAAADVVVLPSWFEGMPLAAIEALAMARPMVATAVDGTVEVIAHERTGLLVPPGDPVALAQAICRLLGDPRLARRLATVGQQSVQRFDIRLQATATGALYEELWRRKMGALVQRREEA
jgi:glycosyltransferase involved in cell wall biosynthesis